MPTLCERIRRSSSHLPLDPTTAPSLSSATVVAGEFRSTRALEPFPAGRASASTLRPTASAVVGLTAADHLVHAKRVGPEGLVAERVEAEDLLALRFLSRRRLMPVVPAGEQRAQEPGTNQELSADSSLDKRQGGHEPMLQP